MTVRHCVPVEKHPPMPGAATLRRTSTALRAPGSGLRVRSVSIYCSDPEVICCRLGEVENTFGDQHGYLFHAERGETARRTMLRQDIHVAVNCDERALPDPDGSPDDRLQLDQGRTKRRFLVVPQTGERRYDGCGIARPVLWLPFLTLKIMIAIHFEAIRLMLQGVKPAGEPPAKRCSPPPRRMPHNVGKINLEGQLRAGSL